MNRELEKEFKLMVVLDRKLKVVKENKFLCFYQVSYKHDFANDNEILFIDDEMNIIFVQNDKNIYEEVCVKNIKNISDSHITKVKCDGLNSILVGTHRAFFNKNKKDYENRPGSKVDYHVISTDVIRNKEIWIKLLNLSERIRKTTIFF